MLLHGTTSYAGAEEEDYMSEFNEYAQYHNFSLFSGSNNPTQASMYDWGSNLGD